MFEVLPAPSSDPILGLVSAYRADNNSNKVDLGAGVYKNERGHTPIMSAVSTAQSRWVEQESSKVYLSPEGFEGFNEGIKRLLLGNEHPALRAHRVASVQTPGGCGALRIAAGMLNHCQQNLRVWVSTPTWANHIPMLQSAGIQVCQYPYYDHANHRIDFDGMFSTLENLQRGDVVLLHGCCHNPSGADLTQEQWRQLGQLLVEKGVTPFIDIAYQGLGDGLDEDAYGLRYMAEHCPELVIASSCSKNFGLYRERVGAAVVVASDSRRAEICRGHMLNVARTMYSMPPSHGAALVDFILNEPSLLQEWKRELSDVRERMSDLRALFVRCLNAAGASHRFDYIKNEKGMFSFLGISPEQVERLIGEKSIYLVNSSRINVAGLNRNNVDYVARALVDIL